MTVRPSDGERICPRLMKESVSVSERECACACAYVKERTQSCDVLECECSRVSVNVRVGANLVPHLPKVGFVFCE